MKMRFSARKHWSLAILTAALVGLSSCAAAKRDVPEDTIVRAQEALAPFKKKLMAALTSALQEGGPEKAIEVCRLRAPGIATAAASEDFEIGRTSHRLRNPDNAPDVWMQPILEGYREGSLTGPRAVRLDVQHVGYVEPIRMKPMCLTCHGEELAPRVRDRLRALYPDDEATGFRSGDFRGLFWVKLRT